MSCDAIRCSEAAQVVSIESERVTQPLLAFTSLFPHSGGKTTRKGVSLWEFRIARVLRGDLPYCI